LIDDRQQYFLNDAWRLSRNIKAGNFDVSISLFSELRTSLSLCLSGIDNRYGPATKIAQAFLNKRLRQKRSKSLKPEYEYNLDLIKYFIADNCDSENNEIHPPYMQFTDDEIKAIRDSFKMANNIGKEARLIIVHPGTGGSAINLSLNQYARLIERVAAQANVFFIITAGPSELGNANLLSSMLNTTKHRVYHSNEGIIAFCKFINACDLFIGGSTGPLHIAGALNINTAAFYPARQSATSLRWRTINEEDKQISFSPDIAKDDNDMLTIDIQQSADKIIEHFFS